MKRIAVAFIVFATGSSVLLAAGCGHTDAARNNDTVSNILNETDSPTDESDPADGGLNESDDSDGANETDETGTENGYDWPSGKYISVEEVYNLVVVQNSDMLLVNVVDEEYYNLGHIEGSLKIPWDTLEDNLDQVDSARHIILYCRRGVRSESAYDTLIANNYSSVWIMEGGIEAWIAAGYPTVSD